MVCDFRALISPHIQICRITVSIMTLRFNSDGSFRVLQLADIQDGPNVRKDTIRLIEAAIHEAHPDLIVFTGDLVNTASSETLHTLKYLANCMRPMA